MMKRAALLFVLGCLGPLALLDQGRAQPAEAPIAAPTDTTAAFEAGLNAAAQGQAQAALAAWQPLADAGNVEAMYALALLYESGGDDLAPDLSKAVAYYQQAAAAGLPEAQTNLGLLYADGLGVEKSQEKAVELWLAGAEQNNPIAQFNLGLAYFTGSGVAPDSQEAVGLVLLAASQGLPEARFAMGQFYMRGLGVPEDLELAHAFFKQAQEAGNADAASFIADFEQRGIAAADLMTAAREGRLPKLPRLMMAQIRAAEQALAANPAGSAPIGDTETAGATAQGSASKDTSTQSDVASGSDSKPQAVAAQGSGSKPQAAAQLGSDSKSLPPLPIENAGVRPQTAPESSPVSSPELGPAASPMRIAPRPQTSPQTGSQNGSQGPATALVRRDAPASPLRLQQPRPAQPTPPQQPPQPSGFVPSPEGLPILEGPKPEGELYVLWLGTTASTAQAAQLWQATLARDTEIMGQLDPILEPAKVARKSAYRLLAGPLPDARVAWQICNAIKASNMEFFCKARRL